jgi:hypothetical protein
VTEPSLDGCSSMALAERRAAPSVRNAVPAKTRRKKAALAHSMAAA